MAAEDAEAPADAVPEDVDADTTAMETGDVSEPPALTKREVKGMKVAELREALKARGCSTDGLKPVLTSRLIEYLEKQDESKGEGAESKEAPEDGDAPAEDEAMEEGAAPEAAEAAPEDAEADAAEADAAEADAAEADGAEDNAAMEDGGEEAGYDVDMEGEDKCEGEEKEEEKEDDGREAPEAAASRSRSRQEKVEEEAKELETDAPVLDGDAPPRLAATVAFGGQDATLNVVAGGEGRILTSLADCGLQHFIAAARANVGMQGGRYVYEVRVIQARSLSGSGDSRSRQQSSTQQLRLGFATKESHRFLGEGEESVGFDIEGNLYSGKSCKRLLRRALHTDKAFAVLLNLDADSPNANTVSLFRDGVRVCAPQSLPESMRGKALFPIVNYKNMVLHTNFGPSLLTPLPFRCLTMQEAAASDVQVAPEPKLVDGKHELIVPVGLPDEGTFSWLDEYIAEHPVYDELSERAFLEWAEKSGIPRHGGYAKRRCNDKPGLDFGVRDLDSSAASARQLLEVVAAAQPRSCISMEVRKNLLADSRKAILGAFDSTRFRKIALAVIGEPPEDFKARAAERNGKRESEAAGDAEAEPDAKRRKVDDPKRDWFPRYDAKDLEPRDLASSFGRFTLPTQDEGFDEVRFLWQGKESCESYLRAWIGERKLTERVEDLKPGSWFREELSRWEDLVHSWRKVHVQWKDRSWRRKQETDERPARRREWQEERPAKENGKKEEAEAAEEAKASEVADGADKEDAADGEEEKKAEDEEQPAADEAEAKEESLEEKKEEAEDADAEAEEAQAEEEAEPSEKDSFLVEDVCDVGSGEPLFANFSSEDWMLMTLRFELHLLVHAFRRDIEDPERSSFHESHLEFYYYKYFKRKLNFKKYGVSDVSELLRLVEDAVEADSKSSMLITRMSNDTPLDNFMRVAEDTRRDRQQAVDMGDESAALKFSKDGDDEHDGYHNKDRDGGYRQSSHGQYSHNSHRSRDMRDDRGGAAGRYPAGGPRRAPPPPPGPRRPLGGATPRTGDRGHGGYGGGAIGSRGGSSGGYHGSNRGYGGYSTGGRQSGTHGSLHEKSSYGGSRGYGRR